MTPFEHRMLRQILTNQFWLLKHARNNIQSGTEEYHYLTCRLDNTDVILKQAYNLARRDKEGSLDRERNENAMRPAHT